MSNQSIKDKQNYPQLANMVTDVSTTKNNITILGWLEPKNIDKSKLKLVVKRRKSSTPYSIPFIWRKDNHWQAMLSLSAYQLDKGIWDFYFCYEGKNFRIRLDEDVDTYNKGIYKLKENSLTFGVYRTLKGALSLKIQSARITLTELLFTRNDNDDCTIDIQATINDSLLSQLSQESNIQLVVEERHKKINTVYQGILYSEQEKLALSLNLDYKDMIHFSDLQQKIWDCYLQIFINNEYHLFRLHLNKKDSGSSIERSSCIEFQAPHIYEIYFYKTINQFLSIKLNRLPVKRDVNHISFAGESLQINGYAFLNTVDIDKRQKRYLIIRKRNSKEGIKKELVYQKGPQHRKANKEEHYRFDVVIPITSLSEMKSQKTEIYDIIIQIKYKGQVYERILGFREFTYIKDDALDKTMLKNKKYFTRVYLAITPRGNLKVETFYLTKLAFYYLKFARKLDAFFNKNKEIWLIGERNDTAQDTGYHFFKYCREHHPDLNIYYVIDSESKDINNIKSMGNVLYSGSLQHVRKAALATTFIGSHDLDNILPFKGFELENFTAGRRIFLQHGVLGRKSVEYDKKYYHHPFDLFCVSSEPEKRLVEQKMGYAPNEVKITGLSRFDHLLKEKKQRQSILLIPTWREWFSSYSSFKKSAYFNRYQSLLKNDKLHHLLEKHDLTMDFYLHYRMQPFINNFKSLGSDRINIVKFDEKNVQNLLIENQLLITDYSSVSFDFNYMSKPVIYYHFDAPLFFKRGILRPITDTFLGDICQRENQLVQAIEKYINNGFKEDPKIAGKKGFIFSHIDTNNSQRIYNEITKINKNS